MCKIIILQKGYTLPLNILENAVYNNPHGFGLIIRNTDKDVFKVIRCKDPKKENDPKEIYDLLKENEEHERYLHVRFLTEGELSKENIHPFEAYKDDNDTILFMHNGTLSDYVGSARWENNVRINSDQKESDSKRFNDEVLKPLFSLSKGALDNKFVTKAISKFWGAGLTNKGLLVSKVNGPLLINPSSWETIKDGEKTFQASNNSYFDRLVRGPEFERRRKKEQEEERERRSANTGSNFLNRSDWPLAQLNQIDLSPRIINRDKIAKLLSDADVWSDEGLANLENMTAEEFTDFIEKAGIEDAVTLLITLTGCFAEMTRKYNKIKAHMGKLNNQETKARIG